jgi:parallel beta-helix repeat protein
MRRTVLAALAALTAIGMLPDAAAQSNTFTVDCNRGQRIATTLEQGDFRKPVVINLRGTCREFVTITRANVTLRGDPAAEIVAPNRLSDLLTISADRVTLENLTLTGGLTGLSQNAPTFVARNVVIQDTGDIGVRVRVGDARLIGCTVQRAGGVGVSVVRGGSVVLSGGSQVLNSAKAGISAAGNSLVNVVGSTVTGSGEQGVLLMANSQATIGTGSTISHNELIGVQVQTNSQVTISDSTISSNGFRGIVLSQGSQGQVSGSTVSSNGANGITVESGSHASLFNNTITANGTDASTSEGAGVMVASADAEFVDNTISNHPGDGVWAERARIDWSGGSVTDNGGSGFNGLFAANLSIQANVTMIKNNQGNGILLSQNSVAVLGTVKIRNNGGWGIALVQGSYVFLGQTTASGNRGGFDLYCADSESSYEGAFVESGSIDPDCTDFNH